MPDLQEVILKKHLRDSRLGIPVRASLTPAVRYAIASLKKDTKRTYRDIFLFILNVYKCHPDFFSFDREKKSRTDVFFRLSKKDSSTVLTWAWKKNLRRSNFIGDITEQFLDMVPHSVFREVLANRADQALRLKKDIENYERSRKRKESARA